MSSLKQITFAHKQATFDLRATLSDSKLKLELQDFIEWVVYEKQYTKEDVGNQIHKRLQIDDIFYSFGYQPDKATESSEIMQSESLKQCPYGSIIKLGEIPRFKIDKGGQVTIFSILKTQAKETVCQSVLILNKIKQIPESDRHNKNSAQQNLLIDGLKLSNEIRELQKQNGFLRQQLNSLKQRFEAEFSTRRCKCSESQQNYSEQLKQIKKQLKYLKFQTQIQANPFLKHFTKSPNNIITLSKPTNKSLHYFFNAPIENNENYTFKIKLLKLTFKYIIVGIADYEKQKNCESSYQSGNVVCYDGNGIERYPGSEKNGPKQEGIGLSEGETVEVNVSLAQKTIKWLVNGTQRASCTHDILGQARTFYPFIELCYQNDSVQYLTV